MYTVKLSIQLFFKTIPQDIRKDKPHFAVAKKRYIR